LLRKIEIKYGFEALEEGNNFLYRNFLRFRTDFELKFREFCIGGNKENSLDKHETLEFGEIWLTSSLLHLIAKEIEFSAKEDQKFESLLKLEFGLISQ
jgi:hypothetical protein